MRSARRATLYYIVSLHQTTTGRYLAIFSIMLYYIVSLHQTTTYTSRGLSLRGLYYIVSLHQTTTAERYEYRDDGCIISFLYIKPQPLINAPSLSSVVLYRFSTSNHNDTEGLINSQALYYIVSLHQTTTMLHCARMGAELYYIVSLHQTTTGDY